MVVSALFWGFLALALALVFLSYFARESIYSLSGFGIIFILGFWILLPGNLQLETGMAKTTNFTYSNGTLVSSLETSTPTYSNFDNSAGTFFGVSLSHFLGFWLGILGALGSFISLTEVRRVFKKDG